MAIIDVDLNSVDDSMPLHPEGPLKVRVATKEKMRNKADDGDYIKCGCEPVDNEIRSWVWVNLSLKDDALKYTKRFLQAAGVQWTPNGKFDDDELLGKELYVNVTIGEWEGNKKNEAGLPYQAA